MCRAEDAESEFRTSGAYFRYQTLYTVRIRVAEADFAARRMLLLDYIDTRES